MGPYPWRPTGATSAARRPGLAVAVCGPQVRRPPQRQSATWRFSKLPAPPLARCAGGRDRGHEMSIMGGAPCHRR